MHSAAGLFIQTQLLSNMMHSDPRDVSQAGKIEVDFFCVTAAQPGGAKGHGEESGAGNQRQGDGKSKEAGRSCAAAAPPGGARKAEIPTRRGENCEELMVGERDLSLVF